MGALMFGALLVIAILLFLFVRSGSDVALSLAGLAITMSIHFEERTNPTAPWQTLPTGVVFPHDHDECVASRRAKNVRGYAGHSG